MIGLYYVVKLYDEQKIGQRNIFWDQFVDCDVISQQTQAKYNLIL